MPLHPQAKRYLDQLAQTRSLRWDEMPPTESRRLFAAATPLFGDGPDMHAVGDSSLAGVPVRIYRPTDAATLPVLIYFHGGGWVLGDLNTHDALCRRLAEQSGFAVVSVDYRVAPENPYPAAFEDAFAVTREIAGGAVEFGFDTERMVVGGDSAGGNLAAAVALKARDEAGPAIRLQLLIYPVIEPNFETESYRSFAADHGLTRVTMQWFWQQYAPELGAAEFAVLGQADVLGVAPAHVITAEFDVLRDEGESYAMRLANAGIPTRMQRYDGMLHGFIHFNALFDVGTQAIADIGRVLRDL